jgi:hypothetical protein
MMFMLMLLFGNPSVNGGSPSPLHRAVPGNLRDTNDQLEYWDDEITTQTSPTSLRPIGAEHRATTSATVGHTGMSFKLFSQEHFSSWNFF